jgi:hypothetical protein
LTERSRTSLLATPAAMDVNLLVREQYDVVEAMTEGRNLSSDALRRAIEQYGRRLVSIPDNERDAFEPRRVPDSTPTLYHAAVHLWTQEEGQSDLTVQLAFVETTHHTFDVEVLGFRVAPLNHRLRSSPSPRERRPRTPSQRQPLLGDPIPIEWRSTFERLVHRLVIGDYAGLARDGVVSATSGPDDASIGTWIERYPWTLIDLPEEAWAFSDHYPIETEPRIWYVRLDLWTAEEGRGDLSLEARVWEVGLGIKVLIDEVHVM